MNKNKKVIWTIIALIILLLAWAPWMNSAELHDKVFEEKASTDGTIDRETGEVVCDYTIRWFPFGRSVGSCESVYYVTFYGQII